MKKNVVLLSLDALRFDCVGYQPDKSYLKKHDVLDLLQTLTIDSIARRSWCYTNAISTTTYTTTAHASLLTGCYPPRHNVRGFMDVENGRLAKNLITLPEVFKANGYTTILHSDQTQFFKFVDLDRGFDYIFGSDQPLYKYLSENPERPIFMLSHFFDIHGPYMYSPMKKKNYNADFYLDIKNRYEKARLKFPENQDKETKLWNDLLAKTGRNAETQLPWYLKGLSKFDQGRLKDYFQNLNKFISFKNTITVIFSDHGEGECNREAKNHIFGHAAELYDQILRIPLIISNGDCEPKIINKHISIVDIYPTVINLVLSDQAQFYPRYSLDGVDISKPNEIERKRSLYAEVSLSNKPQTLHAKDAEWTIRQRCIRTKNLKFIIKGRPERILDEDLYLLPNEEFLKQLYLSLFVRFPDKKSFQANLLSLNQGHESKFDLVKRFLRGKEYLRQPKFYYYNLVHDPNECKPLDATGNEKMKKFVKLIAKIDRSKGRKLFFGLISFEEDFINE